MIHHVVMFRFKDTFDGPTLERVFSQFKASIEALPKALPSICHIHVGRNVNPTETWDVCLHGTFHTLDEVRTYSLHPLHQSAAAAFISYVADRACTDYED
ncbi:MAG: Dabb family protein [Bacteroidaceae bacterium]|nr:Dabb family protein [Bacteroidaceae bacterium]